MRHLLRGGLRRKACPGRVSTPRRVARQGRWPGTAAGYAASASPGCPRILAYFRAARLMGSGMLPRSSFATTILPAERQPRTQNHRTTRHTENGQADGGAGQPRRLGLWRHAAGTILSVGRSHIWFHPLSPPREAAQRLSRKPGRHMATYFLAHKLKGATAGPSFCRFASRPKSLMPATGWPASRVGVRSRIAYSGSHRPLPRSFEYPTLYRGRRDRSVGGAP